MGIKVNVAQDRTTILANVIVAIVYFAIGRAALLLATTSANVTPVWPPAGIALAAIWLLGYRVCPGILLGAFILHVTYYGFLPQTLLAGASIGAGNVLAPATAYWFLGRVAHRHRLLERSQDVFRFVIIGALFASIISACIGVTSLCLSGRGPWSDYITLWWTWWTSNMVGVLIFTPMLLTWSQIPQHLLRSTSKRIVEFLLLLVLLITISLISFWKAYPLEYMLLPLLVWSAFRFGAHGTTLLVVVISGVSILGTVKGLGSFFRQDSINESLLLLQSFVGVIAVSALLLSAVITERQRAESRLKRVNEELEIRVEQRTAQLKASEEAIQTSEAELRALFAAMTELIAVFDAEGRYLKIAPTNPSFLYKLTDDLIGKRLHDVLPQAQADVLLECLQQALSSQKPVNVEYTLAVEGEDLWFTATLSPISANSVIWVARDITEHKQAEEELHHSEEKFSKAFRASINLIAITSLPEGRFLEVNESFVSIGGYSLDELIGHTAAELNLWVNTEERDLTMHLLRKQGFFRNQECGFRIKSGDVRTALVSAEIIDINDQPCAIYVLNDITDRKRMEEALRQEQEKAERLLLNILPKVIADQLKEDQSAIAEQFEEATILFADIVDFTPLASNLSATELVIVLNQVFSMFDHLAEKHGLEKIKTIGDAYMAVGGLPVPRADHAEAVAEMALDVMEHIGQFHRHDNEPFRLRIGINTGSVVAGVIGTKKFIYDLWGDAVNIASRMESQGSAGGIQVTEATYARLRDLYVFEERGEVAIKGKGIIRTYWLTGRKT